MHNEVLETIIKTENEAEEIINKANETADTMMKNVEMQVANDFTAILDKGKESNKAKLEAREAELKAKLEEIENEKQNVPCTTEDIQKVSHQIVEYISRTVFE